MTITTWRIFKPRHASNAFTGEGARLFGGRLNSKGVAVVYTAQSVSLAALEMLFHLQSADILKAYVVASATFDASLVSEVAAAALPAGWRSNPPPPTMKRLGDGWIAKARSAVLRLPSAVVEKEHNYLLNPRHADFAKIKMGEAEPFTFDQRLVKS